MDDFVASLKHIVSMQPVIIGGLAVMARVASPEALIAMKTHALRFGTAQRRASKRVSDLYDVVRLTLATSDRLLMGTPWQLRYQVLSALTEDLGQSADRSMAAALLRSSPIEQIQSISR